MIALTEQHPNNSKLRRHRPDTRTPFRIAQGQVLRAKRKAAKLNRAKVAEKTWISEQTIYCWECGKNSPSGENLYTLAQLYQCSIQDLFPVEF